MKYRLIIAFLLISAGSFGQQYDSTKRLQIMNGDGLSIRNLQIRDSGSIRVPRSAINMAFKDSGAVAYHNGQLIVWNGTQWNVASSTDTTGIRLRPIAGPGISITGTYPNLTFAGNPDTLTAADPLQLSTVSTKKVQLDFRRAWLDSLLALQVDSSGLLDSATLRNDSLFTYTGGVESYRGKVSGGGGGTLQQAYRNDSTAFYQIEAFGNEPFRIYANDVTNSQGASLVLGGGSAQLSSNESSIFNINQFLDLTPSGGYAQLSSIDNTNSNQHRYVVAPDKAYVDNGSGSNPVRFGVSTSSPAATLHIVSPDSNALRIVAPFSNTVLATDSALVIGTDGNVKKAAKGAGGSTDTTSLSNRINAKANSFNAVLTGRSDLQGGIKANKDSLPITTTNRWAVTIDTPTNRLQRYDLRRKADTTGATFTGAIGIGQAPAASALLGITSTSRGLLIPRMTTTQRDAISTPADQLLVANTTKNTLDMYQLGSWTTIAGDLSDDILAYQALGSNIKAAPVYGIQMLISSATLFTGRAYWSAVFVKKPITITGVAWYQNVQGSYTGNNYNGVGLYSYSAGTLTLIDTSTRDANIWTAASSTWSTKALAGGQRTLAPGIYYVAAFYNNSSVTTNPQIATVSNATTTQAYSMPLTTNSARISGWETSISIPPATKTMSSFSGGGIYLGLCLY